MFGAPTRYARPGASNPAAGSPAAHPAAGARYRDAEIDMRVAGASAHGLVAILFDEALKAIDTLAACERTGERIRGAPAQSRALTVLQGLEASLDHAQGGEVARNLAAVYREARRLLATPAGDNRAAALARARAMLADIAGAWNAIG